MVDMDHEILLENLFDGVYVVDRDRNITTWNRAAEDITGFARSEVLGSRCSSNILRHVDEDGNELCLKGCPLEGVFASGGCCEKEVFLHHKQGYRVPVSVRALPIHDADGGIAGVIEVFTNNLQLPRLVQELEDVKHVACHDSLTGVWNRQYAEHALRSRMDEWKRMQVPFGVIFLDIDHFKRFNDSYGHRVGDEVLVMVGKTMTHIVRQSDIVCRWGGEEFVIILPRIDEAGLRRLAKRLRALIGRSFLTVGEERVAVTVSMGATLVRGDDTAESVVDRADTLMYGSKTAGRNRVTFR